MKCPGQDSRFWQPGAIFETECPECGHTVEFFKDESTRRCRKCGHKFVNPRMDFGCATYCQYAAQCLGDLPPELLAQKDDLLKDRVALEMKRYFGKDFKRIAHATKVARYAEQLVRKEKGNPAVVLCAAYLHDIGHKEAQHKYGGSPTPRQQEEEGPAVARGILESLGARGELVDEVCDIIGHHHHPKDEETVNFKVLYDSDLLANLERKQAEGSIGREELARIIPNGFLTESGRSLAESVLLHGAE